MFHAFGHPVRQRVHPSAALPDYTQGFSQWPPSASYRRKVHAGSGPQIRKGQPVICTLWLSPLLLFWQHLWLQARTQYCLASFATERVHIVERLRIDTLNCKLLENQWQKV